MAGPLRETAWGRDGCAIMCKRNQTAAHLLWDEVWPDTMCALNGAPFLLIAPGALPVIGDVLRYTVSPWLGRILMPLLKRAMFSPAPIPQRFRADYSDAMALRPSQIRATSVDGALMIPSALRLRRHYDKLRMPVAIMAGKGDKVVFARPAICRPASRAAPRGSWMAWGVWCTTPCHSRSRKRSGRLRERLPEHPAWDPGRSWLLPRDRCMPPRRCRFPGTAAGWSRPAGRTELPRE